MLPKNAWRCIAFFGLFGSPGSAFSQAAAKAEATARLCWQEGHRLKLTDFRAKRFPKGASSIANKVGAVSATGSTFIPVTDATGIHTYQVASVFVRDSSWINKEALLTPRKRAEALAHEQLHFDIAELAARKLRQRIARGMQTHEDLYDAPASQAIQRIQAEENTLNVQFDQEVIRAGSLSLEAPVRKRWQQRIARELLALAAYKSTAATCP